MNFRYNLFALFITYVLTYSFKNHIMRYLAILFLTLYVAIVNGQDKRDSFLIRDVNRDTTLINEMIYDMKISHNNIIKLRQIDSTFSGYWYRETGDSIVIKDEMLQDIYGQIRNILEDVSTLYDEDLISSLNDIKSGYKQINNKYQFNELHKKLKRAEKKYEKKKPGFRKKLKAALHFRKIVRNELKEDSIDVVDMIIFGSSVLIQIDSFGKVIGELDNYTEKDLYELRNNPLDFTLRKADEHVENVKYLKATIRKLKQDSILLVEKQDNLAHENDSLLVILGSEKNEYDNYKLQSELIKRETEKYLSTREELILDLKKAKADISNYIQISEYEKNKQVEKSYELNERLKLKQIELDLKHDDLKKINDQLNFLHSDSLRLEQKIDSLQKSSNIEITRAAEAKLEWQIAFLISAVLILLGYLLFRRQQIKVKNKKLKEEKEKNERLYKEKELLKKNINYHKGFYEEYLKVSKAEIAIQKEQLSVMLRELNHRTKNNLQSISSLLGIQAMRVKDEKAKEILNNSKSRIYALGLIHKRMYTAAFEGEVEVKMQQFVDDLVDSLGKVYELDKGVRITKKVDDILIKPDRAIPIGLIINEVVTNAFKHAFVNNPNPELRVELTYNSTSREKIYLKIKDNGKSTPKSNSKKICERVDKDSIGTLLIEQLTDELEGKYFYDKNEEGLTFILKIPTNPSVKKY